LQNFEDYKSFILKGSEPISEEKFKTSKDFIQAVKSVYNLTKYIHVEINIRPAGWIIEESGGGSKWDKHYTFAAATWFDIDERILFLRDLNELLNLLSTYEISELGGDGCITEEFYDNNLNKYHATGPEVSNIQWYSDASKSKEVQLSVEEQNEIDSDPFNSDLYTEADWCEADASYIEEGRFWSIKIYLDDKIISLAVIDEHGIPY